MLASKKDGLISNEFLKQSIALGYSFNCLKVYPNKRCVFS